MSAKAQPRRRGILAVSIGALLVVAATALFHEALLVSYGRWLIREDPLSEADAVVVLGGHSGFRVRRAVELLDEGIAARLAMTAEPAEFPAFELAPIERWCALAESLGVPRSSIDVLTPSHSTFDDAWLARRYAEDHGYRRLVFVTDPFHTRRALWVIDRIFDGSDIEVLMAASDIPWFDPGAWWKDERQFLSVTLEYVKLAYYAYAYGFAGHIGAEPAGFHARESRSDTAR